MIIKQSDFHSNPFRCLMHTPSRKSPLLRVILLRPELRPLVIIIPMSHPFEKAFDYTHVPYISDALHIIRSVFKPQFIHFTKYAFLLLFSIYESFWIIFTVSGRTHGKKNFCKELITGCNCVVCKYSYLTVS